MEIGKLIRKLIMKNTRKKGKSMRNGNAPSPYTKYKKTPCRYSQRYHDWRRDRLAGRVRDNFIPDKPQYEMREAAE